MNETASASPNVRQPAVAVCVGPCKRNSAMKQRLLTPGPTPVPEETLLELAKPVFFHRTPEFRQMLGEVLQDLQTVFCTKNPILPLTASGTGALEAALVNSVPPGKKAICLVAGRFGERWKSIAKAYGIEAVIVSVPYG